MRPSYVLTDDAIRAALTPAASIRVPADLAAAIRARVDVTPQRRPSLLASLVPATPRSRALALVLAATLLLLVGLFLTAGHQPAVPRLLALDEPMFRGGPARTGVVAGPGPVANPFIAWDRQIGGPVISNMVAVTGGLVFAADGRGGVSTFSAADGTPGWTVNLGSAANSTPAVAGGLVVLGDAAGDIVALDEATGARRWKVRTGALVRSSAAIADGTVFMGSTDGSLYAVDLATGADVWTAPAGGSITRSAAADAGTVFVGAAGDLLTAFDAKTGNQRWRAMLGDGGGTLATPTVVAGLVLVTGGVDDPTAAHALFGVDAANGGVEWTWAAPSGEALYVGAVDGGAAIVTSADGNVYLLDLPTANGGTGGPEPVLRWAFAAHGPIGNAPAVAAGVVYIAGGDRTVYAVDERSGAKLWAQSTVGQPGALGVVGGRVYLATDLGHVLAIAGDPPPSASASSP